MAIKYEPENLAFLYNFSRLDEKILHPNLKNKIYEIIEKNNLTNVRILRLEQIYPFPSKTLKEIPATNLLKNRNNKYLNITQNY